MQYMIFTFVVLCGGGCVGKSIIQRERESESVALIARASTDIQRAQVACRESTINYLYSVEMNVVYFHLLQQQGEYKQPRTKIVTLYSHSYVLSTCARLLALQLYVYDFFRCTCDDGSFDAGGRTHIAVGQERSEAPRGNRGN